MIISKTPLRISFLGGNTDFRQYYSIHGGIVLATTIDKFIYCIVVKRFDDLIIVNYSEKETVSKVDDIKHDLVREALKLLKIDKGIEITFLSDIPTQGTGLGSSGAVTVGLLNALHQFLGENVSSWLLAEEAVKIELDILKKPIGVQDQHIASMGGLRAIEFNADDRIAGARVEMKESVFEDFNNSLMLLYTGIERKSSEVLSALDINKNKIFLDQNKRLAEEGIVALLKGDLKRFGDLLDVSWESKKELNKKTTNPEIDKMYKLAKDSGCIGAKVIGAGGGGFMLCMFPANKRVEIREKMKNYKELPFRFERNGSRVILNI